MKGLERRINKFDHARLAALCTAKVKEEDGFPSGLLQKLLKKSQLVEHKSTPPQLVTMNSCVEVLNVHTKKKMELTLVFPDEADPDQRRISIEDSVAMALLGHGKGEIVEYPSPTGSIWLKIERVMYQPEAAGNYAL